MKNFHVVDSASHAYQFVWDHKQTIARYAILPVLIKMGCLAVMMLINASDNHLRAGLILLPAHFAEGWFVAAIIIMCMQNITQQTSLLPDQGRLSYKQRLQGSIVLYVTIQLFLAVLVYIIAATPLRDQAQGEPVSTSEFMMLLALLIGAVWAFRFTLIHIPVAMGYGLRRYIRTFKTYSDSVRMLGLMLICTIPAALAMMILLSLLNNVMNIKDLDTMLVSIIFGIVQSLTQMAVLAIGSTAMTYAFYPLLSGKDIKI